MTDQHAELDAALDRVIAAARAHLTAVKAADGRIDDEEVWQAYVTLNNASHEYDELLLDAFGEVTPWDVEAIDSAEVDDAVEVTVAEADDPYRYVISVRQRRDYRVPSVTALVAAAEHSRRSAADEAGATDGPIESVGEAVLELLQAGDGSLGSLDVPQLEPLDGVVAVAEVTVPLDLEAFAEDDGASPFLLGVEDRIVGRLDEHPYLDLAEDAELDEDEDDDEDLDDLDDDDLDDEDEDDEEDDESDEDDEDESDEDDEDDEEDDEDEVAGEGQAGTARNGDQPAATRPGA